MVGLCPCPFCIYWIKKDNGPTSGLFTDLSGIQIQIGSDDFGMYKFMLLSAVFGHLSLSFLLPVSVPHILTTQNSKLYFLGSCTKKDHIGKWNFGLWGRGYKYQAGLHRREKFILWSSLHFNMGDPLCAAISMQKSHFVKMDQLADII